MSKSMHTFVVCAYKESPYLDECLASLSAQTEPSNILIATSTPNDLIRSAAEKYSLPLYINKGEAGIGGDWNFATSCARTPFVTIAHQDDVYEPDYAKKILARAAKAKTPLIVFSGYAELREGQKITHNRLLNIKKILLLPIRLFPHWKAARRLSLAFGNAICCPAVTYSAEVLSRHPFSNHYKSNIDWEQWEILSKEKGAFLYIPKPLMCHRIHTGSATSEIIADNTRTQEDYDMFRKFWPKKIAAFLSRRYAKGEESNRL